MVQKGTAKARFRVRYAEPSVIKPKDLITFTARNSTAAITAITFSNLLAVLSNGATAEEALDRTIERYNRKHGRMA
jgi:ASC-1-like (ASCH) protein